MNVCQVLKYSLCVAYIGGCAVKHTDWNICGLIRMLQSSSCSDSWYVSISQLFDDYMIKYRYRECMKFPTEDEKMAF